MIMSSLPEPTAADVLRAAADRARLPATRRWLARLIAAAESVEPPSLKRPGVSREMADQPAGAA
jgi:hypothetical protein